MFNNQNLPFRADVLEQQQVAPPDARHFMNAVPSMQNIGQLQEVLNAVANEIYNNANKNQVRVFQFNQCTANNWCNNDFLELVNFTIQYINYGMQSGMRASMQEFIAHAVSLYASRNLANYPALQQYCSQAALSEAGQNVQTLDGIIASMQKASQMPMMRHGWQNQNQNQNMGFGTMGDNGVGRNFGATTTITTGGFGFMNTQQKQEEPIGSNFGNWNKPVQPQQPVTPVVAPVMQSPISPTTTSGEVDAVTGWNNWIPSVLVPYIPAVRWRDYDLTFKHSEGLYVPVIRERNKTAMDYEAHRIPTMYGYLPREYQTTQVDPSLSISSIVAAAKVIGGDVKDELYDLTVNPKMLLDVGIDQVWFDAALDRQAAVKTDQVPAKVYHTTAVLVTNPIIDKVDHTAWLADIRNSRTLIELHARITSALDIIPKPLWRELDTRLTNKLRRVLMLQLALPTLNFDSFTEDYPDVQKVIEQKYGDNVKEAFLKNQKEIVRSVIGVLSDVNSKTLTDAYGGDTERTYKVTYIAQRISLTILDFDVTELSIEVPSTVGVAITQDQSPEFHRLASEILKLHESEDNPVEAHFIRTNDFFTFEIAKGYLGNDFITMMLHSK